MEPFRVTVGKEELGFAAAHFIAYQDGGCERLHGHNYRVAVTLAGRLNEAGYVYDFLALRAVVEELVGDLDHRLLLPGRGGAIRVSEEAGGVRVRCGEREYLFPAEDVRILPVDNTTSERLAAWLAGEIAARLPTREAALERLEVEVEESPGRSARSASDLAG